MKKEITVLRNPLFDFEADNATNTTSRFNLEKSPKLAIPGHFFLGQSYDVIKGQEIPHPYSFLGDLIDRQALSWKEANVSGHTFQLPEIVSDTGGVHHGKLRIIESDSIENYATELNVTVEASASYGMFEGSLHSNFKSNESRYKNRKFGSATDIYQDYVMYLVDADVLRKSLKPRVLELIDSGEPADIVKELGTHYINGLILGGRVQSSFTIDTSSYKSDMSISATIKASYNAGIGKISSTVSSEYKKAEASWEKSTIQDVSLVGGDERLSRSVMAGKYDEWLASLAQSPAPVGFPGKGLKGIWHLAKSKAKREAIKKEVMNYMQNYQPLGAVPRFPVQVGDRLAFIAANGFYMSSDHHSGMVLKAIGTAQNHIGFEVKSKNKDVFSLYSNNKHFVMRVHYPNGSGPFSNKPSDHLWAYSESINNSTWWKILPATEGRFKISNAEGDLFWYLPNGDLEMGIVKDGNSRNYEFDVLLLGPKL